MLSLSEEDEDEERDRRDFPFFLVSRSFSRRRPLSLVAAGEEDLAFSSSLSNMVAVRLDLYQIVKATRGKRYTSTCTGTSMYLSTIQ